MAIIEVIGDVLYPIELQRLVHYITSHHKIRTVSIRVIDFVDQQHQIIHTIMASAVEVNITGCCYTDHDIVALLTVASQMTSLVIGRDGRCFYDGLSNPSVLTPSKTARCPLDRIYYRQERGSKNTTNCIAHLLTSHFLACTCSTCAQPLHVVRQSWWYTWFIEYGGSFIRKAGDFLVTWCVHLPFPVCISNNIHHRS